MNLYCSENMISSYGTMNFMRLSNHASCDIKFKVGTTDVYAHKVVLASNSKYFEKLFYGNFKESTTKEIVIDYVDPVTFGLLIDFMYTSKIHITDSNVQDLLSTSRFWMFDNIYKTCIEYVKDKTTVQNCLEMKLWSNSIYESQLEDYCTMFALLNFEEVYKTDEFLLVSFDQINEFVGHPQIKYKDTEKYEAIVLWIKYDINGRSRHLPALISYVDKKRIPITYFLRNMKDEDILKNSCQNYLRESLKMFAATYKFGDQCDKSVILSISLTAPERYVFEWISTGDEVIESKQYVWRSKGPSIILSDLRVFIMNYFPEYWGAQIFDGKTKTRMFSRTFKANNFEIRSMVQLNDFVYLTTTDGKFRCYNLIRNYWSILRDFRAISTNDDYSCTLVTILDSVYHLDRYTLIKYDHKENKWLKVSTVKYKIGVVFTACSSGQFLYICGTPRFEYKGAIRFDVVNNTWSEIENMRYSRVFASSVFIGKYLYVLGGQISNSCEVYDPDQDKWLYLVSNLPSSGKRLGTKFTFGVPAESHLKPERISSYYAELNYTV